MKDDLVKIWSKHNDKNLTDGEMEEIHRNLRALADIAIEQYLNLKKRGFVDDAGEATMNKL